MRLSDVISKLEAIAPTHLAESWDNVGLLAGDVSAEVKRAIVCIDYTDAVAREAKDKSCGLVLSYHPPLFEAVKKVVASGSTSLIHDAIRRGVAIYSPHTALDVAEGGTNDVLADVLMLKDRRPLRVTEGKAKEYKLVTFVPKEALEKVSKAIFDAGAGQIGDYSSCSFRSEGTGTFFGEEGTNPAVGQAGKLEQAAEVRIETIVPISKLAEVVGALKKSHPYEEPAFDLMQLAVKPQAVGIGRIGKLPGDVTGDMLIQHVKRELGVEKLLVGGDLTKLVKTAAVCAGAGGSLLDDAIRGKADLYLTGELRHHDVLKATRAGMMTVCALHSNSERVALKAYAERIAKETGIEVLASEVDRDPLEIL